MAMAPREQEAADVSCSPRTRSLVVTPSGRPKHSNRRCLVAQERHQLPPPPMRVSPIQGCIHCVDDVFPVVGASNATQVSASTRVNPESDQERPRSLPEREASLLCYGSGHYGTVVRDRLVRQLLFLCSMDTNTLLLIIVVILLLGGGGFYFRRR